MVTNPAKLHVLLIRFCMLISKSFAISVYQICINAGIMLNVFSIFDMLVKDDVLYTELHQSLLEHINRVAHRVLVRFFLMILNF